MKSYSWIGCSWWCPRARAPCSPRAASGWAWNACRGASYMWVNDTDGFGPLWMSEVTYSLRHVFQILRSAEVGSRPGAKLRAQSWWTGVRMTGRGVQESLYTPLPMALCIFNKYQRTLKEIDMPWQLIIYSCGNAAHILQWTIKTPCARWRHQSCFALWRL